MAAGNWIMYNSAREYIGDGVIDLDTHTFKILLTSNSYTPNPAHTVYADITNQVANGNGYTTGGATLANVTWGHTGTTATWDADDVVWTASGGSIGPIRNAVIYDDTPSSPAKPLVCYCVLDSADITVSNSSTFTIAFNASGILTLSGADS